MELQTHFEYTREDDVPRGEPAPLRGWKLIISWILIFSFGWVVALATIGGLYWLFNGLF